jgi:two-component system response regulator DesR
VERCIPARSAEEAMQLTRRYEPHVALIDVFFAGGSGMDVCRQLKELRPSLRILLMSAGGTISIETARSVRAFGVIPKEWSMPQIAQAVEMVANGIPLEVQPQAAGLSAREREVLTLVATGATNNQIAAQLYLSPHTVKDHISSIFRKLGVRNRAEAVQRGHRLGLTAGAETAARAVGS